LPRSLQRIIPLLTIALWSLVIGHFSDTRGQDSPFNQAANWGGTGLLEIPNARILGDGVIRAGVAQALPYRWYSVGMGVLPGLEFSGRLTQLTNIQANLGSDYGDYKDKAFDVKYQIFPESRRFPALAIGLQDFHGTQLFPAQYIVLSRQIYPFDFTIGIGRDRLEGLELPLFEKVSFLDDLGLFAGVEIALHPRVHFLAEYNPIDYEDDRGAAGRALPEGATLPVNFGLKCEVYDGVTLGVSYQRGDTLGVSLDIQALLGQRFLPQRPDPPLNVPVDRRPFSERDYKEMTLQVSDAIHKAGFFNVSVYTDGSVLLAEFENSKYLSDVKAVGRVLRILLFHSPEDTRTLTVVAKRRDIPIVKVSIEPEHLKKYLLGRISERIFRKLIQVEFVKGSESSGGGFVGVEEDWRVNYMWDVKPSFETFLNDPSGFFKYRPGIKPFATASAWQGGLLHGMFDIPFYSNIESSNVPPPDAVRSDAWKYSGRDYTFERLLVDQAVQFGSRTFGRVHTGLFERMYGGIGGEILTFLGEGRFAIGLEADFVKKRMPGTSFEFEDFTGHTFLANVYYRFPDPDVTLRARVGRFLGGDEGVLLDVSRRFDTGVIVGGWYSITNTEDVFTDPYNRGYNEKGVFISLPARMFLQRDSAYRFTYAISPWTRDVAATPAHWQELFGMITDLSPGSVKDNMDELTE